MNNPDEAAASSEEKGSDQLVATHLSVEGIVEPLNELDTGGFAASGFAYERHRFATIDLQVQRLEHLDVLPRRVAERNVSELDLALDGVQPSALLAETIDRRHAIDHIENRGRRAPGHRERLEMRRGQPHVLRSG